MIKTESAVAPELDAEVYDEIAELTPLAGPWPRYWARMLDLLVGTAILAFVAGLLWPALFAGENTNFSLIALALIPVSLFLEAGVLALVGTTPGKAIAGIRVQTFDLERPSFQTLIARNMRIWLFGLALGIPLIALATLSHNHRKVANGDSTSWDEEAGTRVFATRSSLVRTSIVAVLYIAGLAGLVGLGTMERSAHDQLLAEIPEMNRGLPKTIDSATILNHVGLDASTVIYDYTLTSSDGSTLSNEAAQPVVVRLAGLQATNRANLCGNRASNLIGKGISMRFRYSAQGGVVTDYTISPSTCG